MLSHHGNSIDNSRNTTSRGSITTSATIATQMGENVEQLFCCKLHGFCRMVAGGASSSSSSASSNSLRFSCELLSVCSASSLFVAVAVLRSSRSGSASVVSISPEESRLGPTADEFADDDDTGSLPLLDGALPLGSRTLLRGYRRKRSDHPTSRNRTESADSLRVADTAKKLSANSFSVNILQCRAVRWDARRAASA